MPQMYQVLLLYPIFFLLTIAFVFITRKQETTAAFALITSFRIVTDLIAASVIGGTLVHVYQKGKKIQSVHWCHSLA